MSFVGITNYKMHSTRCPGKHHKEFYKGKSLVDIKINQLLRSGAEHVFVSTNDPNVKNTDHVTYVPREEKFCDETSVSFAETMAEIYRTVPIDDDQLAVFTFTMCPLFDRYDQMYNSYLQSNMNQLAVYPAKHYYLDVRKRGVNFMFGYWHPYSQGIDPVYQLPYCGLMAKMSDLRECGYTITRDFDYFEIETFENFDIDTEDEFQVAQMIYQWRINSGTLKE